MHPSETPRPRARAAVRLLAVVAALVPVPALLACGSSNSPTAAAASEHASEQRAEQKATEFAKCLREHGVNASASAAGGGFQLRIQGAPGGGKQSIVGAQKACAKYQPEPKKIHLSPQEKVKREEEVLKFAKCMREHGIDIHTEVGGGAVGIGIHGSSSGNGPNPASPAFQSAQKACSGYLKLKPKGGFAAHPPGAGGPPGPSEAVQSSGG
jgi:hypothetical protein